jgi:hypothetical protein
MFSKSGFMWLSLMKASPATRSPMCRRPITPVG